MTLPEDALESASFIEEIAAKDRSDNLAHKRSEFELPEKSIYLNGNSLGPLPQKAKQRAREIVEQQWGVDLIASWNKHHWIDLPVTVGEKIAPLIGAAPGQVICCDSISINLFKLFAIALQMQSGRRVMLSQRDNFPTDLYVAQGLGELLGKQRCDLQLVEEQEIEQSLNENVAVLFLTQVNFRSGKLHDIEVLTRKAHSLGILVIWDLAHSTGVLPLELDAWDVDFAVGCGYKFLNGGPGAPAFIYANKKHQQQLVQPLQAWMGHSSPFEFDENYVPAEGMGQFLTGTPPILSMGTLDAALDVFKDVAIGDLRQKSNELTELFLRLIQNDKELKELHLESPADGLRRGSQLSFSHPQAYSICRALHAESVLVDFRSPNLLRVGFSPLILGFEEIRRSVKILSAIVAEEKFLRQEFSEQLKVT